MFYGIWLLDNEEADGLLICGAAVGLGDITVVILCPVPSVFLFHDQHFCLYVLRLHLAECSKVKGLPHCTITSVPL